MNLNKRRIQIIYRATLRYVGLLRDILKREIGKKEEEKVPRLENFPQRIWDVELLKELAN